MYRLFEKVHLIVYRPFENVHLIVYRPFKNGHLDCGLKVLGRCFQSMHNYVHGLIFNYELQVRN